MTGIVVGVDGSEPSRHALTWAADEAALRRVELLVMQSWHEPVIDGPGMSAYDEIDLVVHDAKQALERIATGVHESHPTVQVSHALVDLRPARALLARARDAEMVVVGSRGGGGFLGLELGSVSMKVARRSTVPAVVIRGEHDCARRPEIVVGVDGSECSRRALRWAYSWAKAHDKNLVVVMAWNFLEPQGPHGPYPVRGDYESIDADGALGSIVSDVLGARNDPRVSRETFCELPARAVLQRAGEACLIVVGRHGTSRWAPPELSATAVQILHHASCPVAVIPEAEPSSGSRST